MTTLQTMDSSIIALIILSLIYVHAYSRAEEVFTSYRLFISLVQTNMAMIMIDILGWIFNGLPEQWNMLANIGFNLLLYICVPLGPILWILYADFQIYQDENHLKSLMLPLVCVFFLNMGLSIISVYSGWFFMVDAANIYHRGSLFWVHVLLCYALMAYSFLLIVVKRNQIEKRYYYSLLLFQLPQALGTTIQVFAYGVSYNWTGMMLSLLTVYFNIQDRRLHTDYLTGAYNRRQLDSYIKGKISSSTKDRSFSAVLIDLNDFKQINDSFGHDIGDEALKNAVAIIKGALGNKDFIARFGGDEFFVLLETDERRFLEQTVQRIRDGAERFNKEKQQAYRLTFSMGYAVYDCQLHRGATDFFKQIDSLMYLEKKEQIRCKQP